MLIWITVNLTLNIRLQLMCDRVSISVHRKERKQVEKWEYNMALLLTNANWWLLLLHAGHHVKYGTEVAGKHQIQMPVVAFAECIMRDEIAIKQDSGDTHK